MFWLVEVFDLKLGMVCYVIVKLVLVLLSWDLLKVLLFVFIWFFLLCFVVKRWRVSIRFCSYMRVVWIGFWSLLLLGWLFFVVVVVIIRYCVIWKMYVCWWWSVWFICVLCNRLSGVGVFWFMCRWWLFIRNWNLLVMFGCCIVMCWGLFWWGGKVWFLVIVRCWMGYGMNIVRRLVIVVCGVIIFVMLWILWVGIWMIWFGFLVFLSWM